MIKKVVDSTEIQVKFGLYRRNTLELNLLFNSLNNSFYGVKPFSELCNRILFIANHVSHCLLAARNTPIICIKTKKLN